MEAISDYLIHPLQLPELGDTVNVLLPIICVAAGLDSTCRIVDGMRGKKNATVQPLKSRLNKEIMEKLEWVGFKDASV